MLYYYYTLQKAFVFSIADATASLFWEDSGCAFKCWTIHIFPSRIWCFELWRPSHDCEGLHSLQLATVAISRLSRPLIPMRAVWPSKTINQKENRCLSISVILLSISFSFSMLRLWACLFLLAVVVKSISQVLRYSPPSSNALPRFFRKMLRSCGVDV